MPSSSDAQRQLMHTWFGDCDTIGPMQFLFARGWTEEAGMYTKPTPTYNPSVYEVECLLFLRDEWDFDFHKPLFPEFLA